MNTKQLVPITGALIVGLIGVASAACYGFNTHLCHAPSDTIDPFYLYCPNANPPGYHTLYATGYWWGHDAYEITEPGHDEAATETHQTKCYGLASYIDCNGSPHSIFYYDNASATYTEPDLSYPPPCEW